MDIDIDIQELIEQGLIEKDDIQELSNVLINSITSEYLSKINQLAKIELRTTLDDYISSIQSEKKGNNEIELFLEGKLANALEEGKGPYSMKEGLLSGPNVKIAEDGIRYNNIPFKFGQRSNKNIYSRNILPQSLFEKFKRNQSELITEAIQALSDDKQKNLQGARFDSNDSTVTTFRRISDNSSPSSFKHPGFKAHNFFKRSFDKINAKQIAEESINEFLSKKLEE